VSRKRFDGFSFVPGSSSSTAAISLEDYARIFFFSFVTQPLLPDHRACYSVWGIDLEELRCVPGSREAWFAVHDPEGTQHRA